MMLINSSNELVSDVSFEKAMKSSNSMKLADKLLFSKNLRVFLKAVPYVSSEGIINALLDKETIVLKYDMRKELMYRLSQMKIWEKDVYRILCSFDCELCEIVIPSAPKEQIIDALIETDWYWLGEQLRERLSTTNLTRKEVDQLLFSNKYNARLIAIPYASMEQINEAMNRKDYLQIGKNLLERLSAMTMTEKNWDRLLFAKDESVRITAVTNVSQTKLIKTLLKEKNKQVKEAMIYRLVELGEN